MSTLLSYAVATDPNPLQVSPQPSDPSLATLTIIVSNDTHQLIDCQSISFDFSVGTDAKDFFSDATGIGTSATEGWSLSSPSAGVFTATPDTAQNGSIGAGSLIFVLSNILVNAQPGTTDMTITEVTTSNTGTLDIPLAKFPQKFKVGELIASPPTISSGGSTTLFWSGTSGAIYEIQYQVGPGTVTISDLNGNPATPLPSTGGYTINGIEQSTTFYLLVTLNLPGLDQPLTATRFFPVTVVAPPSVLVGTVVAFAGPLDNLPPGWIYCAGQEVSGATYPQLVTLLGTIYGTPQTAGNVVVPNYMGLFLRGVDTEGALDFDCQQRESPIAGNPTVVGPVIGSRQGSQVANHNHPIFLGSGTSEYMGGDDNIMINSGNPVPAVRSETRPVNAYIYYLIYGGVPQA